VKTTTVRRCRVLSEVLDPPDLDGARHWCERAAEANNADADDYLENLLTDRPEPDVGSE